MGSRHEYLKAGMTIALVLIAALPVLTYPLGADQGIFATGGRAILHGGAPYTDLWDFKPPAIFYVYSLSIGLFGETVFAVRVIDFALFIPLGFALYWIAKQLIHPLAGILTIIGFGVLYFTESFWTLTQNEGVALLPMSLLVVLMMKAIDAEKPSRWMFAAGVMAGIVFWFKYPFAILPILLLAGYLFNRRQGVIPFIVGGICVVVGGLLYLLLVGAVNDMLEIMRVTLTYSQGERFPDVVWNQAVKDRWSQWGILLPLILISLGVFRRLSLPKQKYYLMIWLWLIASVMIMLIQAKGYDYHWLPILPPAVILASLVLINYFKILYLYLISGGVLLILFTRVWFPAWDYITLKEDQLTYYAQFQAGAFVADDVQRVADYLNQRTIDGDSLFVYGFHTELYYLTGLYPATRYVFQVPLVGDWYPTSWREENVALLWAAMPQYVVVVEGDYIPWMTGRDADSYRLMQEDTELINWLYFNYTEEIRIGTFIIWKYTPPESES